jgi:hypothetical protein
VPELTLLARHERSIAILGGVTEPTASTVEAHAFVRALLQADRIAFDPAEVHSGIPSARRRDGRKRLPTHAIRRVGGRRMLVRVRFACGGPEGR